MDGQNRIYTPYMTVYFVISLPKVPYIHRICMALANSINTRNMKSKINIECVNRGVKKNDAGSKNICL
jgi:hypothetical protein